MLNAEQTEAMLYPKAVVALVMPLLVDVVVPALLLQGDGGRFELDSFAWAGVPLIAGGALLLLDSVFLRFAREGRGTLAPLDPPRFVVRGGAYRFVRNPMYVANVTILAGEGLVFGSWWVLAWAGAMLVAFHLFVIAYEEPHLHAAFGDTYDDYRRTTGRWVPRLPLRP